MKKKTTLKRLLVLFMALIMIFSLFSCGKQKEEDLPPEQDASEEQGDGSPTVTISLNRLLELANKTWTFNELISSIFTDYVAYTADDGVTIKVEAKKKDVPAPSYDYSKIVTDEKGFLVSRKKNGNR